MSLSRRTLFLITLAGAVTACSGPTSPPTPRATVVVQLDTVAATRVPAGAVTWIQFRVPVAIHNAGAATLTLVYCASAMETRGASGWDAVWSPICAAGSGMPLTIAPGETGQVTVDVIAAVDGPGGPTWRNDTVSGTYRFGLGLAVSNVGGPIPRVASNAFVLVEGN